MDEDKVTFTLQLWDRFLSVESHEGMMLMVNIIGYSVVIGGVLGLLLLMYYLVKAATDDSDKYKYLKDIVEILFNNQKSTESSISEAKKLADAEQDPFEEACPACDTKVTQLDRHCPGCGLKVMD